MTVSYTQKLNAFQARRTWTIKDAGLHWVETEKDKRSGVIPWDKITKVRLCYEPSRAETRRVGLHIYAPYPHYLTNIDYAGIMNFRLQKEDFKAFVVAFHRAIPDPERVQFCKGSVPAAWWGNLAVSVFVLLLLLALAPILAVTGVPGVSAIARILIIVVFLPILFKVLKKNRPGSYEVNDIPDGFL